MPKPKQIREMEKMPLKLVRVGDAIARIDANKKLKETKDVRKVFVWGGCPYLKDTGKESRSGKIWYCSFEDKFSNDAVPFVCQTCDKYKLHKSLTTPQW